MPIDRLFPAGIPEADVCIAAGDIVEGDTVGAVQWLADTIGMSRSTQIGRTIVLFATSAFLGFQRSVLNGGNGAGSGPAAFGNQLREADTAV